MFKKLINYVYDSEINCRLEWNWDGGFTWSIQDSAMFPRIMHDDNLEGSLKIVTASEEFKEILSNPTLTKDWVARGCREDIDDAFYDMFDAIIKHFPKSSAAIKLKDFDENREHFVVCEKCGDLFDCRDLSDVFSHEHDEERFPTITEKFVAQKEGDPTVWYDGKPTNLN